MNNFEKTMILKITKKLSEGQLPFICYRLKQSRFCSQYCDILVDSPLSRYYWAIECKSRKNKESLDFSQDFSMSKKGHQLNILGDFSKRSGRIGYVFFKSRSGIFVIKVEKLLLKMEKGHKSSNTKEKDWVELSEFINQCIL